ncbi:hypothetical protein [Streptomyces cacaoi]|uniref:Uncharacterized protein n=1 Tax=Streptomyces cacaoi TaxID=1898 RepID=A0A4Y3QRE2_STRCI|nr:hypothetical protein [Streptomyces cacaoi]NNG88920.1 hypothetical protein [Streptomyces cacaoi]GEB47499.1 hypothetical protein SCA03_00500 [Streptomyces cacaoi]
MTQGERGEHRTIRVALDQETVADSDVEALKRWLEREPGLEPLTRGDAGEQRLRIEVRPAAGAPGTAMGAGSEIVIVLLTLAAQPAVNDLYGKVVDGVRAWRANRRSVEPGEPPEVTVDPPPHDADDTEQDGAARADGEE